MDEWESPKFFVRGEEENGKWITSFFLKRKFFFESGFGTKILFFF